MEHPRVQAFMAEAGRRNPNEPEFLQAVEEVAEHLGESIIEVISPSSLACFKFCSLLSVGVSIAKHAMKLCTFFVLV